MTRADYYAYRRDLRIFAAAYEYTGRDTTRLWTGGSPHVLTPRLAGQYDASVVRTADFQAVMAEFFAGTPFLAQACAINPRAWKSALGFQLPD